MDVYFRVLTPGDAVHMTYIHLVCVQFHEGVTHSIHFWNSSTTLWMFRVKSISKTGRLLCAERAAFPLIAIYFSAVFPLFRLILQSTESSECNLRHGTEVFILYFLFPFRNTNIHVAMLKWPAFGFVYRKPR